MDTLILFVRKPELGKVKTRLAAGIGKKQALEVYNKLLHHTRECLHPLSVQICVWYAGEIEENDLWEGFEKYLQQGNDLGERMEYAFRKSFLEGASKVVIIGSDNPWLQTHHITQAFDALQHADAVIGPAEDGGYYLLGMRRPFFQVFKNKSWSTETVLKDTLKDLHGKDVILLETLNDVDRAEDLIGVPGFESYLKINP